MWVLIFASILLQVFEWQHFHACLVWSLEQFSAQSEHIWVNLRVFHVYKWLPQILRLPFCKYHQTYIKVIYPKYYKHMKKGAHQSHLGRKNGLVSGRLASTSSKTEMLNKIGIYILILNFQVNSITQKTWRVKIITHGLNHDLIFYWTQNQLCVA